MDIRENKQFVAVAQYGGTADGIGGQYGDDIAAGAGRNPFEGGGVGGYGDDQEGIVGMPQQQQTAAAQDNNSQDYYSQYGHQPSAIVADSVPMIPPPNSQFEVNTSLYAFPPRKPPPPPRPLVEGLQQQQRALDPFSWEAQENAAINAHGTAIGPPM